MDSGADANLMDATLARELDFLPLSTLLEATALDSRLLWQVTHHTTPVTIIFPDRNSEFSPSQVPFISTYFAVSLVSSAKPSY